MRYQDLLANKNFDLESVDFENDRTYDGKMNPRGKSSKHLKEFIIPELQAKAAYYKKLHYELKANNETKKDIRKKINQKKKQEVQIARRQLFGKAQGRINVRAMEMYYDKIKTHKLDRSNYLDGVLSYPIIKEWLKYNTTLNESEFRLFMVFYCHKWMHTTDCENFGFDIKAVSRIMKSLVAKGFAEAGTFKKRRVYYSSTNASHYFRSYMIFQRKRIVYLCKMLDEKQPKREGDNWVRYNKKLLNQLDIYEETNFNGFDERTD